MDASSFAFSISVPREAQFVPMVRGLAIQAARYASCRQADVELFATSVEAAVRACLHETSSRTIAVVVRRDAGPLEFLIDGRTVAVEP